MIADKKIYFAVCCTLAVFLVILMIYREIPSGKQNEAENFREKLIPEEVTASFSISEECTAVTETVFSLTVSSASEAPETEFVCFSDGNSDSSGLINLNTADKKTLMTLKGIGDKKAESIIEYRNANGCFTSVDDLSDIPGIGSKTVEAVRDYVTV